MRPRANARREGNRRSGPRASTSVARLSKAAVRSWSSLDPQHRGGFVLTKAAVRSWSSLDPQHREGLRADEGCCEELVQPGPSTSEGLRADEGRCEELVQPGPSTSGGLRADEGRFEPHAGAARAMPSSSSESSPASQDIELDIGSEVVVKSSSLMQQAIGVTDTNLESIVLQQLSGLCDSDDDLAIDDDYCIVPPVHDRNATTEPACDSDLNAYDLEILQREDEANDQAVREFATDDCFIFQWSNDRTTFGGQREQFTGTSGPTFQVTDETRPVDIFDRMIDTDFIDRLVTETNRYAEHKIALLREQGKLSLHSRFHRWTPTNRDEMVTFLALLILQGLFPVPEEEGYFNFNGFGTMPYFSKVMSFNRYILLKAFLHFVDNTTTNDRTKLSKIRPILDYLNEKFSSLYMPSQEIVIDESLLKWQGRLSFAQKISSKAARVGVKTYELCESSSGYLWKFFVYTGKDGRPAQPDGQTPTVVDEADDDGEMIVRPTDQGSKDDDGDRPTGATAKVVYDLIEPLLHRGHTLIMDNFYNSPLLLRSLKRRKTDCYGTLRLNREFVPDHVKTLSNTDLRQGEVVATYCPDLSILVWRDANLVSLISTYHTLQIGTQEKYNKLTYKPSIVIDYNKSMGGVDRKDQFLSAHPLERVRNRVWYKKLFRRLYNAALFNCYVIFSTVPRKMPHRQFRKVLAEDLLRRHRQIDLTTEPRLLNVRPPTKQFTTKLVRHRTQARPKLEHNHFPIRTGSKYTCCLLCPKKTRTIWKCEECNVNLCIEGCFKAYHK